MQQGESGWTWDPNQTDLWQKHGELIHKHNKLVRDWNKLDTSKNSGRIRRQTGSLRQAEDGVLAWLGNRGFLISTSGCESCRRRATISIG